MKRIALFFCVCLFALSIQAQGAETIQKTTTHLKFLGVELDRTISEFEKDLPVFLIAPDPELYDKHDNIRVYDADYWGEPSLVVVFFNPRSKIVYCARVIKVLDKEKEIKKLRASREKILDRLYGKKNKEVVKNKIIDNEVFSGCMYSFDNGYIALSTTSPVPPSSGKFTLTLEYVDKMNYSIYLQEENVDVK